MRILVFSFALRRSLNTLVNQIGPGRMRSLVTLLAGFLFFNFCLRLVLAVLHGDPQVFAPGQMLPTLAMGALFDVGVASYALAPIAWWLALSSRRQSGALIRLTGLLMVPLCGFLGLMACAELLFWRDHGVRFNGLAVESLLYPHEAFEQWRHEHGLGELLAWLGLGVAVAAR